MPQAHFEFWSDDRQSTLRSFALPGARPHYTPDRPGQVEHVALNLVLDLEAKRCQGTCTLRLNPICGGLTQLKLDAVNQVIQKVTIAEMAQPFDYDGEQLRVTLLRPTVAGQVLELTIVYQLDQPQRGLYFVGPDEFDPQKPVQVWTQGEDEDSRYWFPCFDYPGQLATSELRVTVPQPLQAISNGELVATNPGAGTTTYHWQQQQPHPTYLMTLAVGDFVMVSDQWRDRPVTYYVAQDQAEKIQRSMGKTPRMIEFFSQKYGYPYAFPKYAQVCVADFIFGGMENTSATLLTDRCLLDERASLDDLRTESLVAHELAHQWFGDLVVVKHWSHAWLKEGMASYAEVMWIEQEYGPDDAAYYRLLEARNYLSEDSSRYRRPIVTHVYRAAIELYDRHLYEKGACVYHMIRTELGEEQFWSAIAAFVQQHAHSTVETIDLLRAIEQTTGRNLLFLFDQYVYRGGHPDYKVSYSWDQDSHLAQLTVIQTQAKDDPESRFDLKLPVAFGWVKDDRLEQHQTLTVRVHETEQSFYFPLPEKPQFISFDAGNHYLKTVTLNYPLPELKAQLRFDPDPLGRMAAAAALGEKGGLEAVKALDEALTQEPFWGVRVEVVRSLVKIKLDQVFPALLTGMQDQHPRVRRAAVEALGALKTPASFEALAKVVLAGDLSYSVEAEACRALGSVVGVTLTDRIPQALDLLKTVLETRSGWNEVVRSGAIAGLSQIKSAEQAVDLVLAHTQLGTPQPLRLAAIRALGPLAIGQPSQILERILDRLGDLARETFFLTQVATVAALGKMETTKAIAILSTLANQALDKRVKRMADEAIQQVQKHAGPDQTLKQLREDLDQLKQENQTLRSRLEALEAKTSKEDQ